MNAKELIKKVARGEVSGYILNKEAKETVTNSICSARKKALNGPEPTTKIK